MDRLLDEQGLADYLGVSHAMGPLEGQGPPDPVRLPGGRLVRFHADDIAEIVAAGHSPALSGALATR
jgi:hypothetical protein